MINKIPDSVKQVLLHGTKDDRKYLCRNRLYFAAYYFREYFTHKIPQFHAEMYQDLHDLEEGQFKFLLWSMFGGSAKSSIGGVIETVYDICYQKKHYINFDSEDKGNAEQRLFDIAVALQTNPYILEDFGALYNSSIGDEQKKMKRVSKFITENDIMVEAFSVYESVRGRLYKSFRPDSVILDDFENKLTKKSVLKTQGVIDHIKEMFRSLGPGATVKFLCNYISDSGSVQYLLDLAQNNPDFRVRMKAGIEMGQIVWKDRFVSTDEEANLENADIPERHKWKISVESLRRTLKEDFDPEFLNDPVSPTDLYFNRKRVDRDIAKCEEPLTEIGGWKIWREYDASHKYAIGSDTSMGVGRDSNTGALGDFTCYPPAIVATYKNNKIAPDKFAYVLKKQAQMFGQCLIGVECNAESGGTCNNELKHIYNIGRIYHRPAKDKETDKPTKKIGWESNAATVPEMASLFRSAYHEGHIEILDPDLLKEMRNFTNADLEQATKQKRGKSEVTKHFDLLRAAMICWAIRLQASFPRKKEKFVQSSPDPLSDFENVAEAVVVESTLEQMQARRAGKVLLPGDENEIINVRRDRQVAWKQPDSEPLSDFES